jgi:hypothetical protein
MLLHFPNLDTLQLALTSGTVPRAVSLAPVAAVFAEPAVWVEPSAALPRGVQGDLRRLGVQATKSADPSGVRIELGCWPQLLPLRKTEPPALTGQTPVLFELHDTAQLPELVGEILRLGNDRQSFRWLESGGRELALLRVLGPPYYALLRALEREHCIAGTCAYLERAPRVWVEIGHTHPLVQQLAAPEGKILLVRAPRDWRLVDDGPLRDIYDILEFPLAAGPAAWKEQPPATRITVPLTLAPASAAEAAELWVLREHGFEQVDELVRTSDELLVHRLAFAAGERDGKTTVVLRVRPSRLEPPALVLVGESYRPYLKLPNLFLPCGKRLQPPLRRDVVRQLLAGDPDHVTWLAPHADGTFTPESLPDSSFRPLTDWVDYVLLHERVALQTWVEATTFDFEPFVCKDEQRESARARKKDDKRKRPAGEAEDADVGAVEAPDITVVKKTRPKPEAIVAALPELPKATPTELQKRLHELEQQFLALEGALDDPHRLALWPELAGVYTALGHGGDGSLCWLQALWQDRPEAPAWAQAWCLAERVDPAQPPPDDLLGRDQVTAAEVRGVAAWLVAAKHRSTGMPVERLRRVQQFLQRHEELLPVRAVWLAALAIFRLSHGDVLGLTRTRDRLLERLYSKGLAHDQDLPSFLRFSGIGRSERLRAFRDWLLELPARVEKWVHRNPFPNLNADADPFDTNAYAEIMLAFGLARLGEDRVCGELLQSARSWLEKRAGDQNPVHAVLLDAFEYRIHQALTGKAVGGPLPPEQMAAISKDLNQNMRYKVDRMRMRSRILEPHEKIDAFRTHFASVLDEFNRDLVMLPDIIDRPRLEKESQRLLAVAGKVPARRLHAVEAALKVAPRLGEEFALERLAEVPELCRADCDVFEQANLLEQALFVAAHFNQAATVQQMLALFLGLLQANQDRMARDQRLEPLVGQCFRGLRKVGLNEEIRRLLATMTAVVTNGRPFEALRKNNSWVAMVRTLLHVAAGQLYFNEQAEARRVLEEARLLLFDGELQKNEKLSLACAYIATLAWAPVDLAMVAIDELLERLEGVFDGYETRTHFSISKLEVVEAIVLAVVTEEFAMGQVARRWLEDDEYVVRRRVHYDVQAALGKHG